MAKAIHIGGIVCGYIACIIAIVVGAINQTPGIDGWKFILMGIVCAACATVAIVDGARALPQIGMWKVGAKFEGLSDVAFLVIFGLLAVAAIIVFSVN